MKQSTADRHTMDYLCPISCVQNQLISMFRTQQAAKGGENLRLRLAGIDDDDIASGFVVCSRDAVVPAVTYFNAQLQARPTLTLTPILTLFRQHFHHTTSTQRHHLC